MTCAEYPVTPLRLGVVGPLTAQEATRAIAVKVARLDAIWKEILALGFTGDFPEAKSARDAALTMRAQIEALKHERRTP